MVDETQQVKAKQILTSCLEAIDFNIVLVSHDHDYLNRVLLLGCKQQ